MRSQLLLAHMLGLRTTEFYTLPGRRLAGWRSAAADDPPRSIADRADLSDRRMTIFIVPPPVDEADAMFRTRNGHRSRAEDAIPAVLTRSQAIEASGRMPSRRAAVHGHLS